MARILLPRLPCGEVEFSKREKKGNETLVLFPEFLPFSKLG